MKKHILITRPNNQTKELRDYLASNNCEVFVEPTFTVDYVALDYETLEKFKKTTVNGIIVTSLNATKNALIAISYLNLDKNIKIFAVGKKTGENFAKEGYKNVIYPNQENATNLQKTIIENSKKSEKLLYFCGEVITLDFKQYLNKYNILVEKIVSYKIQKHEFFSKDFLQEVKKRNFDYVLLYSKNTSQIFFDLLKKHHLKDYFKNTEFLCFSEEIALFVQKLGFTNSTTFAKNSILKKLYD